jgi:uncharacterized protein
VSDSTNKELIPLTSFTRKQRRVLGVLLEKAFTVPDQYPMTLKATTTGCNQKSNREPVTNYEEIDVSDALEDLRKLGFVGVIQTEGGRTERYRHYLRIKTELTGPQLAILTELMLRGRQQLGELRTRASRMVAIESQEDLRRELQAMLDANLVCSNGPLERRGIEVDHNLYPDGEKHDALPTFSERPPEDSNDRSDAPNSVPHSASRSACFIAPTPSASDERVVGLEATVRELKDDLAAIRDEFRALQDRFEDLRRQLGG